MHASYLRRRREGIIAANLYLRCADRVFVELHSFFARSFTELFDGVRAMPWHTWLPADANVTVTGKTALSDIKSIRDVQKLCKKALCDAMCAVHGYDRCPETGQEYQIEIGILRDRITVGLNTSGAGLNRRGYRDLSTKAPLRETLAAALVTLARYHGNKALVDPCCGSGTIAIEGAMIAAHMAPGLLRTFAFDGWKAWQADAHRIRERAKGQAREAGFAHLYGFDIDENQISIAHRHAKNAGVNGFINFETVDVHEFVPPSDNCVIVTNPPYGQRFAGGRSAGGGAGAWQHQAGSSGYRDVHPIRRSGFRTEFRPKGRTGGGSCITEICAASCTCTGEIEREDAADRAHGAAWTARKKIVTGYAISAIIQYC